MATIQFVEGSCPEALRALLGASCSSNARKTWVQGTQSLARAKRMWFIQPLGCGLEDWEAQLLLRITLAEEH